MADYSKLDIDGIVKENVYVNVNDAIIGKVIPYKKKSKETSYKDNSIVLKANENGLVFKVYSGRNGDGYKFCKVQIKNERYPTVGDKFSSRHGQKGTIGMTYRHEDMPCTKDGITPDIIVNPHAIPSRMTIGQLIECVLGKSCTMLGTEGDSTHHLLIWTQKKSLIFYQMNVDLNHMEMKFYIMVLLENNLW